MKFIKSKLINLFFLSLIIYSCNRHSSPPPVSILGKEQELTTKLLTKGSQTVQDFTPINQINLYLNAFHPMKKDFSHQMEAHHYCQQVNDDFAQCIIYDGNTKDAHMTGIEYIISEKLFNQMPVKEKEFWHPHNYEILSGQLIAPGLPDALEKEALKKKINSYGKTWHVWMTGNGKDKNGDNLPLGDAMLAWSFTRDGQLDSDLISNRDKRFKVHTPEKAKQRKDLKQFAKPQQGEDLH